jgi:hypothetical protein
VFTASQSKNQPLREGERERGERKKREKEREEKKKKTADGSIVFTYLYCLWCMIYHYH